MSVVAEAVTPVEVASPPAEAEPSDTGDRQRRGRRWLRRGALVALLVFFAVELVLAWPSLTSAVSQLHAPKPGWVAAAVLAELIAISSYARMQRRLLRSTGLKVPLRRHIALAYAAHSVNETLPGGPAFSAKLNYQQMRSFGASPAIASWAIAFSSIFSTAALAVVTATGAVLAGGTPPWLNLVGLTVVAAGIIIGTRQIARHPQGLEHVSRVVLARINRVIRKPEERGLTLVLGFISQLGTARLSLRNGAAAATFALINWGIDAAALWMCLRAVSNEPINIGQLLLAFCAGMAAATLTIVPGGLGIVDNALILGLITGGVSASTAIAAVVLYRIISLGFIIGAGWIAWLLIHNRRADDEYSEDALESGAGEAVAEVAVVAPQRPGTPRAMGAGAARCLGKQRSGSPRRTSGPTQDDQRD